MQVKPSGPSCKSFTCLRNSGLSLTIDPGVSISTGSLFLLLLHSFKLHVGSIMEVDTSGEGVRI